MTNTQNENDQNSKEKIFKENAYKFAKYNLDKGNLIDIAASAWAQSGGVYGEKGAGIMGEHIYDPALNSEIKYQDPETGEEKTLVGKTLADTLRAYRKDGQIGSGQVTEAKIMQTAVDTIERSISYLKVEDIAAALGKDPKKLKADYKGKQVFELMPEIPSKEEQEEMKVKDLNKILEKRKFYESLVQAYRDHLLNARMKKAIDASEKKTNDGLEKILLEPAKEGRK